MRTKIVYALLALVGTIVSFAFTGISQTEPTKRAIFFNNTAYIVEQPNLPLNIDGAAQLPGRPWFEPRIFDIQPDGSPPSVNPTIEVITTIPPSFLFRPPGRIIPSPFDDARLRFRPTHTKGFYSYVSRWPRLFTPRDARNTVVLTLVNRGRSILFNTNFDLYYAIDQEIIEEPSGTQAMEIQLTPLKANSSIIVRLRSQSTEEVNVEVLGDTADPPPSSHTSDSVIWSLTNPTVDKALTFTVQVAVKNLAHPMRARHVPGLLITASGPTQMLGTGSGASVEFPEEFLPAEIKSVRYSISKDATWRFEHADRTLVDIREVTELVP